MSPWGAGTASAGGGATSDHEDLARAPDAEAEPDVRYTLANERTFLAWNRTALALVVAAVSDGELRRNQTAMRRRQPLPRTPLPRVLAAMITGIAVLAAVVLLVSAAR